MDKVFLDILESVQLANDDGVEVAHEHKVEILHGYLLVQFVYLFLFLRLKWRKFECIQHLNIFIWYILINILQQVLLAILECIENCMKYIHEAFSCINICQVHSLPVPVLLIVKSTFNHCKVRSCQKLSLAKQKLFCWQLLTACSYLIYNFISSFLVFVKESENIYGSIFHDVSQELSLIFRKAFELQKVSFSLKIHWLE